MSYYLRLEPRRRRPALEELVAGGAPGLVGVLGDAAALAGDERGRDRPLLPARGTGDARRQRIARLIEPCRKAQAPVRWPWRGTDLDTPHKRAHGADAAEEGVAREIVAAGPGRPGRRHQAGGGLDEVAGAQLGRLAHRHPHPRRALAVAEIAERLDAHDGARPLRPLLHAFDEAGERRDGHAGEHRRLHPGRPGRTGEEAGKEKGGGNRRDEGRIASRNGCHPDGDGKRHDRRPDARLAVGREIEQHPDAEAHRRPGEQAPVRALLVEAAGKKRADIGKGQATSQNGAASAGRAIEHGGNGTGLAGSVRRHAERGIPYV